MGFKSPPEGHTEITNYISKHYCDHGSCQWSIVSLFNEERSGMGKCQNGLNMTKTILGKQTFVQAWRIKTNSCSLPKKIIHEKLSVIFLIDLPPLWKKCHVGDPLITALAIGLHVPAYFAHRSVHSVDTFALAHSIIHLLFYTTVSHPYEHFH